MIPHNQHYSDPERADDDHALPDLETFYISPLVASYNQANADHDPDGQCICEPGWYWHACFPGCLPDSDPFGPYDSEADALADARGE